MPRETIGQRIDTEIGEKTPTDPSIRRAIARSATPAGTPVLRPDGRYGVAAGKPVDRIQPPPKPAREAEPVRMAPVSPELDRAHPPMSDPTELDGCPDSNRTLSDLRVPSWVKRPEPEVDDSPSLETRVEFATTLGLRTANKLQKLSSSNEAQHKKLAERVGIVLILSVIGPILYGLVQIWSQRHPVVQQSPPIVIMAPTTTGSR